MRRKAVALADGVATGGGGQADEPVLGAEAPDAPAAPVARIADALPAHQAEHGVDGATRFMVCENGVAREAGLGPDGPGVGPAIGRFDPGADQAPAA